MSNSIRSYLNGTVRVLSRVIVGVWLLVSVSPDAFPGEGQGASELTVMDNGATVISKYVPDAELVAIQLRVLSGLSNEGKYAGSGISHFLEHLLFKGTRDHSSEDIRRAIKHMGGSVNGSTGMDSAEYHIIVPRENFDEALKLLVRMVSEPVFSDEDLSRERDVILKEIRLRNDDPRAKRSRKLFQHSYNTHVYGKPIIGKEEEFNRLTREDILDYHDKAYSPDRMVLGIVGGVPSEAAEISAVKALSSLGKGKGYVTAAVEEPGRDYEAVYSVPADVTLGYIAIGFHTTDLFSPDLYPCDVLSLILGEGDDSRLFRRLVKEKQLLYSVSSLNYTPKYPGLFVITGIGEPEKMDEARKEIFTVIGEMASSRIEENEMERSRNMVISEYLHSHERIKDTASVLTNSVILTGDPDFFEKYVDLIALVKEKDVKRTLERYLRKENSTTVYLLPKEYAVGGEEERIVTKDNRVLSPRAVSTWPEVAVSREEKETKSPGPGIFERSRYVSEVSETFKEILENGITVIARRKGSLPLVSVVFVTGGGTMSEDAGENGISEFTSHMMLKGTGTRVEREIVPEIERMGGMISNFSGKDSFGIYLDVLSKDYREAMDIFCDVLKAPAFPGDEIEKHKKKTIALLEEQEKDIFQNGVFKLKNLLYGEHPYSRRFLGKRETVESFDEEKLMKFYRDNFVPKGSVIAVVGDIDPQDVLEDIKERLSSWNGVATSRADRYGNGVPEIEKSREDILMDKEQSLILVGFPGVEHDDERRYDLEILSSLMSGSDGLLYYGLREAEGAVYTSGAASVTGKDPGFFLIYAATIEEKLPLIEEKINDVISRMKKGDMARSDIADSKTKLIAEHSYSLETNNALCLKMALDAYFGVGPDRYAEYPEKIRSVSADTMNSTARDVFAGKGKVSVVIHSNR